MPWKVWQFRAQHIVNFLFSFSSSAFAIFAICLITKMDGSLFSMKKTKMAQPRTRRVRKSAKKKKNHEQRSRGRLAMITKKKSFEIFTEIPNGKNFLFVLDWASSKMWFVMIGSMDGSARIFLSGSKMKNRKSFEIKIKNYAKSTFFLHEMHQHFHIFQIFCVFFKFP